MATSRPPEHFAWKQHDSSPGVYRRPTLSSESLWASRPRDVREIFVSGEVIVSRALKAEAREVETAVRRAWETLRFEVPELGVKGLMEDGETWMQYVNPQVQEIGQWVERTLFFSHDTPPLEFADLRREILIRKGDSDDPVVLLLHFHPAQDGEGQRLSIMMNTDHLVTDGIGTRILFGKFSEVLSKWLSTSHEREEDETRRIDTEVLEWRESWHNLSPPWISILKTKPAFDSKEVEETVIYHRDIFMNKMSSNPGLPLRTPASMPSSTSIQASMQKAHFHTFTTSETTSLITAIKTQISPQATITHLVHAAMVLALLPHIPSEKGDMQDAFYSSCWLSGRRYLKSDRENKGGGGGRYIPICMAFHPIIFEGLEGLRTRVEGCGDDQSKEKEVSQELCKVAMSEYGNLKSRDSALGEFLGVSKVLRTMRYTSPVIYNSSLFEHEVLAKVGRSNKSKGPENDDATRKEEPRRAAPLFLSDGVTEMYISRSYSSSTTALPVIEVNDIHFAANADAEVVVRLSTFRDRLRLSAEWKSDLFEDKMARDFVEGVKGWMMSLLE